ncbi:hypothetical protein FJ251_00030 [bacterium]|nr:hypothetical protein [bacterium]
MPPRKNFLLRIPEPLWEDLQRWAADELRSVNAQIEFLLQRAVAERRGGAAPPAESDPRGPQAR